MTFVDIVSVLRVPDIRKKRSVDNIAWILNCVPLPVEQQIVLKQELELDIQAQSNNLSLHYDGEFIMVSDK